MAQMPANNIHGLPLCVCVCVWGGEAGGGGRGGGKKGSKGGFVVQNMSGRPWGGAKLSSMLGCGFTLTNLSCLLPAASSPSLPLINLVQIHSSTGNLQSLSDQSARKLCTQSLLPVIYT